MPMPASIACSVEAKTTGSPRSRMRPLSGRVWPARMDIRVDLPAPFSPSRARMRPAWMSRLMSRLACTAPKALLMPSRRMIGVGSVIG